MDGGLHDDCTLTELKRMDRRNTRGRPHHTNPPKKTTTGAVCSTNDEGSLWSTYKNVRGLGPSTEGQQTPRTFHQYGKPTSSPRSFSPLPLTPSAWDWRDPRPTSTFLIFVVQILVEENLRLGLCSIFTVSK